MEIILKLNLPEPLNAELNKAADDARCSVEKFAAEVLESELASRRLPLSNPGRCGARLIMDSADD